MYQNIRFLDVETKRQKCVLPCTPLAIVKILEYLNIYNTILPFGNRLFGHTICVVNRSEVVGRPLAALLANDGACVYSVDITGVQKFTRGEGLKKKRHEVHEMEGATIKDVAPLCDVVISGVPGDKYKFDTSLLREGAVCVNFSSEKVCSSCSLPFCFFIPCSVFCFWILANTNLPPNRTSLTKSATRPLSSSPLLERSLSSAFSVISW